MRNWSWLLISLAAWSAAALGTPPGRVEIACELERNGTTVAEVLYQLEHDGHSYRITETWRGRGLLALRGTATRISRGRVSSGGLKPLEFADSRSGRSTARASFDWENRTVTMQYKGDPRVEPLPANAHDRLAFLFDFAFAPPNGEKVEFQLLDGRGQSKHVYSIVGRERLKTAIAELDTVKLVRVTDDERTEIWFAPERSFLPLRLLVTDKDGTRYDQRVIRMSGH